MSGDEQGHAGEATAIRTIVEVLIAEGGMTRKTAEQIAPGLHRAGVRAEVSS